MRADRCVHHSCRQQRTKTKPLAWMDWHVSYYAANWSIVYELKRGRQEEEARRVDTAPFA